MYVRAYTDGSCRNRTGAEIYPMGYAAVIDIGETGPAFRWELAAYNPPHEGNTNNRAELLAVTLVFAALNPEPCKGHLEIVTDSMYTLDVATQRKQASVNLDIVHHLQRKTIEYAARWYHVRGHQGHPENERADELCKEATVTGRPEKGVQTVTCRLLELKSGDVLICGQSLKRGFQFQDAKGVVWKATAKLF